MLTQIRALRAALHNLAERPGEEANTKACLMRYLQAHTSLRLEDRDAWFCALHREPGAKETVAFRAELDAVPFGEGARHLCGHDGHCAALSGLGLLLEGKTLGKNVLLLFQPAEETGAGGEPCAQALPEYGVKRIYAFHNIPGYEEGAILLRRGTFACASRGMALSFQGAPSHAAHPEYGRNPGFAAARLIAALPALTDPALYTGLAMATLVGARIGEKAFGSAAGSAEVWLTLRAYTDTDIERLTAALQECAQAEAGRDGVECSFSYSDCFPATVNDDALAARAHTLCQGAGLRCSFPPEPFRWSEDFGHYGAKAQALLVGVGAGKGWPQLHTAEYEFNDAILPSALALLRTLAQNG